MAMKSLENMEDDEEEDGAIVPLSLGQNEALEGDEEVARVVDITDPPQQHPQLHVAPQPHVGSRSSPAADS